jgi:hypothetical protein
LRSLVTALMIAAAAGCSNDPIPGYLAEMREAATQAGLEQPTDAQALGAGEALCSDIGAGDARADGIAGTQVALVARQHCDIFPLTEEQRAAYGVAAASPATPAPATEVPTRSPLTERGTIPTTTGEKVEVRGTGGVFVLGFTVNKIQVDPKCNAPDVYKKDAVPTAGGHFVAMSVDVETGAEFRNSGSFLDASEYIGPDGYTVASGAGSWPSYLCAGDQDRLTSAPKPGSKYRGVIMLNVPTVPGSVVITDGKNRWEYQIPAA